MKEAEIIQLSSLDEEDQNYAEFIESLKEGAVRAVFLIEKEDGSLSVGTNSKDRRDLVYDIYRLQGLCKIIVDGEDS